MFSVLLFSLLALLHSSSGLPVGDGQKENEHSYKTKHFIQKLDHFNFINKDYFKQKYLISKKFWKEGEGPIFVYTGNEGEISLFSDNTGFMWDIAPEFGAMLLFIEHRYYGESLPNLNQSSPEYFSYLNSVQVLEDFAAIVDGIKRTVKGGMELPVIAFGGSYGGMLAAWMRMKYPHLIQGALASSAPMLTQHYFKECRSFAKITSRDFERESPVCSKSIRRSWDAINNFNATEDGRHFLSDTFHLCEELNSTDNVASFREWLNEYYGSIAMANYPYPANFLGKFPAWPIKKICSYLTDESLEDRQLLEVVSEAFRSVVNSTGELNCLNISSDVYGGDKDMAAWEYQTCTELPMPYCSDGEEDMLEPEIWDFEEFSDSCNKTYNVIPDPLFVDITYGEKHLKSSSNIIFSNGDLDPWSEGGILEPLSDSLVTVRIEDGAHHLDLRGSDPADPPSVIKAREIEKSYIRKWIDQFRKEQKKSNET